MRTLEDALDQLAYHPATPEVAAKYAAMRAETARLVKNTWDLIPSCPEKTIALRGLQQFLMHANLAIALTTPADYENPDVARQLPGEWTCADCGKTKTSHDAKNVGRWDSYICDTCAARRGHK